MWSLYATLSLLLAAPLDKPPGDAWKIVAQTAQATVWRSTDVDPGSVRMRLRMQVAVPIARVVGVLWDVEHACEWMVGCRQSELLERRPESFLQYRRTASGPLSADRDVVLENHLVLQPSAHRALLWFRQAHDPRRPPQPELVRMARLEGCFALQQLSAQRTEVVYEAIMDPGGGVPTFLLNALGPDKLLEVFDGLRARLQADAPVPACCNWDGFL